MGMLRGVASLSTLRLAAGRTWAGGVALRVRVGGWAGPRTRAHSRPDPAESGRPRAPRWRPYVLLFVLVSVVVVGYWELRTSSIEAFLLSRWAGGATFSIEPGVSGDVVFPSQGPFNERSGYTRVPQFQHRLTERGFVTVEQARFSPTLSRLARWGISPPYREPTDPGLRIEDRRGEPLFDFARRRPKFERFEDIPLPVLRTLLYIEDRRLADTSDPRANPVVDWGRFVGAGARYLGSRVGIPFRVEGGSTLATQMEKYRHSGGGRTESGFDKILQMTSASLKVYRDGTDTMEERRQIVLDYLNTVPLAAAPRYGEVTGLGEGLRVWFGVDLDQVRAALERPGHSPEQARIFKQIVSLIYAVRAPSNYLLRDRQALGERVDAILARLGTDGVVDPELIELALAEPLGFPALDPPPPPPPLADAKAVAAIRQRLGALLGEREPYVLDRIHADVRSTIDGALQQQTVELFRKLEDPEFVRAQGLVAKRLLDRGDPANVVYSLLLLEATDQGNLVRVHADSLRREFDVNSGMKMELGSTAKMRTLVHYLDLVAELHRTLTHGTGVELLRARREAHDPITVWAVERVVENPHIELETLLGEALERRYSANPGEGFFTGGGLHYFRNFEPEENSRVLSVREATVRSNNLAFIRLMRDLVRFHEARLPYDARAIFAPETPEEVALRASMLHEVSERETHQALERAYRRLHAAPVVEHAAILLGKRADSERSLAVLFFAWNPGSDRRALAAWLAERGVDVSPGEAEKLRKAYGMPLSLTDSAWLAGVDPLALWCAGKLAKNPSASFEEVLATSEQARAASSAWLFKTGNRRAQDVRLRTRIERDAFDRMTPYWQRLGFPFERMVASYASAIGSSADRPTALAELMGILVNGGELSAPRSIDAIRLGPGTPYHTSLEPAPAEAVRVLPVEVARAARGVLAGVVAEGTARRLRGGFVGPDGTEVVAGGKTGSGDNRKRRGSSASAGDPLNRTATFVFFVGDRYYGVITASVDAAVANDYGFTSSLPLAVLRLLGPSIAERALEPAPVPATSIARASGS